MGSVTGCEVGYGHVEAIALKTASRLRSGLAPTDGFGAVLRRGTPDATYIFKHALLQDTAYDSLLRYESFAIDLWSRGFDVPKSACRSHGFIPTANYDAEHHSSSAGAPHRYSYTVVRPIFSCLAILDFGTPMAASSRILACFSIGIGIRPL